jgi:hypothetical protein
MRITLVIMVFTALVLAVSPPSAAQSDEQVVLDTVQAFFDALAANDAEASRAIMLADGQYFSLRQESGGESLHHVTNEDYFGRLEASSDVILERMWDPTVLVHQTIALVWTPYDIYRNGDFMHCGVDAFSLIRTDAGWQIASIVYTVEPEGCAPSPLGPLGADGPPLRLIPAAEREARGETRARILDAVHGFSRALAANSVEDSRRVLLDEGQGYATTLLEDGSVHVRRETNEEYFEWLETNTDAMTERMWGEIVLEHGPIAFVWTPYDFHVNGELSHCGINAVSLIRTDDGWKSADWVWTVERDNCEESPLGPVGRP